MREAFNFITLLRVTRFIEARNSGCDFSDLVSPVELNTLQRKMLKDSFAVIEKLQSTLLKQSLVKDNEA